MYNPRNLFLFRIPLATLDQVAFLEDKFGEWKPVSRGAGIAWLCFYALFLLYAFTNRSGFLFLDFVNLIIHEGGHFFFSWFGNTIMILGGTLGELLVPLVCAIYFLWPREATGFAFCSFWFFPWSAPATPTGKFSSASGASSPRTRKSAESCAPSAGSACSPPWPGLPTVSATMRSARRVPI